MGSAVSTDYVEAYHYQQPKPIPMEFKDFHFFALDAIKTFIESHNNNNNDLQNTFDLSIFQSHNHLYGPFYGQFINEQRNGIGVQNYMNKVHIVADFEEDKIKGEVLALFKNNTIYVGLWNEQLKFGNKGLFYDGDIYIGQFLDKQLSFGFIDKENYEYYGSLKNGMREGVGRCCFVDGTIYEGEWLQNQFHGNGILYYPNNTHYIGQFNKNIKEGLGIQKAQQSYIGEYMNNKFHGLGRMLCVVNNKIQITQGKFENGIPSNLYCCYFEDNPKQKQWFFRENGEVKEVKNAHKNIDIQKLYTFKNTNISDPNIIKQQIYQIHEELDVKIKNLIKIAELYQQQIESYQQKIIQWLPIIGLQ